MAYQTIIQTPEEPIIEQWEWTTDVMRSYDGTEDFVPLNRYPKRTFSGVMEFDSKESIRRHAALMQGRFGRTFKLPLFQYKTKLKAAVSAGVDTIAVNALRSDFRVARLALIIEGDTFEEVTVESFDADSVTFTTNLVNSYSARATVCPVVEAFSASGATISRRNPDDSASVSFTLMEKAPWEPFVSSLNEAELTTFDGFTVFETRAIGREFEQKIDTGLNVIEYIGLPDVFSPWEQSQWVFPLSFLCNRVWDLDAWYQWIAFADHIQGAATTFLLPTFRSDLEVVTPVAGSGTQVTVEGDEYSQHYWGLDTFARIVIDSDAGRHYAKVTGIVAVGGNDRLTFTPAVPAGAGWTDNQRVEFLLKVRSADDKLTCTHYGLQTNVSMSVRTVS